MKNAVHYDVVPAFGVNGGGGQNVQNGGGPGLQLGKVGLLLTHDKAFERKRLVIFLFWGLCLFLLLHRRFFRFLLHYVTP